MEKLECKIPHKIVFFSKDQFTKHIYIYIHEASATIKSGKCQVYEKTDLRSDNDEAVGSDVSDELRVERVVEKIAMEENQQWEFSGL